MSNSGRGGLIEALVALRGAASESSIRENVTVSTATKVHMQVQAFKALVFVAVPGTLFGAWLTQWGLREILDLNLSGPDVAFGLLALAIVAFVIRFLVLDLIGQSSPITKSIVALFLSTIAVVFVIFVYTEFDGNDWFAGIAVLFGMGFLYGGPLLIYNQTMVLRDPMGWQSPFETRYMDIIEREKFGEDDTGKVVEILEVRDDKGLFLGNTETLEMPPDDARRFARVMVQARFDLTEDTWAESEFFASRPVYRACRGRMVRDKWAEKKGNRYQVTSRGKRCFYTLLD